MGFGTAGLICIYRALGDTGDAWTPLSGLSLPVDGIQASDPTSFWRGKYMTIGWLLSGTSGLGSHQITSYADGLGLVAPYLEGANVMLSLLDLLRLADNFPRQFQLVSPTVVGVLPTRPVERFMEKVSKTRVMLRYRTKAPGS